MVVVFVGLAWWLCLLDWHGGCVCWVGMEVVFVGLAWRLCLLDWHGGCVAACSCGWYGDDLWYILEHSQSDVNKRHLAGENSFFSHSMINFR